MEVEGREVELAEGESTLGRSRTCTIPLQDAAASRSHVQLIVGAGMVRARDLQSSNGTYVNGMRLQAEGVLEDGDRLTIGETDLVVRIQAPSTAGATVVLEAGTLPCSGCGATVPVQASECPRCGALVGYGTTKLPMAGESPVGAAEPTPGSGPSAEAARVEPAVATGGSEPPPFPAPPSSPAAAPSATGGAPTAAAAGEPQEAAAEAPSWADAPIAPPPRPEPPPPPPEPPLPPGLAAQAAVSAPPVAAPAAGPPPAPARAAAPASPLPQAMPDLPPPAGFAVRAVALLIDWAWMALVALLATIPFGGPWTARGAAALALFALLLFAAVPVLGWWRWGATPGKSLLGLTVRTLDGATPISLGRALARWLATWASACFFGLGFLLAALTPARRALHDWAAATYVARRR